MYKIEYTERYLRIAKKFLKEHKNLVKQYNKTLKLLEIDPYHNSLRLHKFSNLYSVSINMQYRISINFIVNENKIIPINIGDHIEIYGRK